MTIKEVLNKLSEPLSKVIKRKEDKSVIDTYGVNIIGREIEDIINYIPTYIEGNLLRILYTVKYDEGDYDRFINTSAKMAVHNNPVIFNLLFKEFEKKENNNGMIHIVANDILINCATSRLSNNVDVSYNFGSTDNIKNAIRFRDVRGFLLDERDDDMIETMVMSAIYKLKYNKKNSIHKYIRIYDYDIIKGNKPCLYKLVIKLGLTDHTLSKEDMNEINSEIEELTKDRDKLYLSTFGYRILKWLQR